jgi:hypothetical protein
VGKGQYLGFIELGSQVNLIIPREGMVLVAKKGDKLEGFRTVVAKWII